MLLSVVTGTYNRLGPLERMVKSVRQNILKGLEYEIVVVDGGSTDGTIKWCNEQKDIRLIEHGGLKGAIKAFSDGAVAASGEYVVLANDDIIFLPYGLIRAISHLESNMSCGAVAFADNRTSLVTGDGLQYRVEGMGATTHLGKKIMVNYAQVGMIRRDVGNSAGWWGFKDPIMSKARTYGGDNFLSAQIWEMGLTVDAVPGCVVQDFIERDELRGNNNKSGPEDSRLYYTRYPTVHLPEFLSKVQTPDRLRILYLPVYESGHPASKNLEYGMNEALSNYGISLEWDYLNSSDNFVSWIKAWQPDLLLMQIQGHGSKMTPHMLASARTECPSMVVVNWNGDAHETGLVYKKVVEVLRYVDIQTVVNARVLDVYEKLGINAAYWQIGYKDPVTPVPEMPEYDVLFQGNCYDNRRTEMVTLLRSLPFRVGVYGNCQGSDGNTHYSFAAQRGLYKRAKVNVGDTFPGTQAFASNRFFQCLAAGGFLLQQRSERFDDFNGTREGTHYIGWSDHDELLRAIHYWMQPANEGKRKEIAQNGMDLVRQNFSYDAQVKKLFEDIIPRCIDGVT